MQADKDIFNSLKEQFLEFYLSIVGIDYYFTAKDAKNLKLLQKKIEFSCKASNVDADMDNVSVSFSVILKKMPNWYRDTPDISIINSHYNKIIAEIKGSQQSNNYKANILKKYVNKTN